MNQSVINKSANKNKIIRIKPGDLPISCPIDELSAWSSHPRVFLELDSNGEAHCQYCGTQYILDNQ
jgi:uncharacterized Zn-finger protein